jgi:SPP1 family predicted phage head-tail adaptor
MPKCNNRVTVEKKKSGLTVNPGGHTDDTNNAEWQVMATGVWCEFKTRGSREFFRGEEVAADITHQITTRYTNTSAQITTDMRLRMDGRIFNIAEPPRNVDEDNKWIVFAVTEIK